MTGKLKPINPVIVLSKATAIVLIFLGVIYGLGQARRYLSFLSEGQNSNNGSRASNDLPNIAAQTRNKEGFDKNTPQHDNAYKRPLSENADDYDSMEIDPAIEIKDRVWVYSDPETPWLNDLNQYRRAAGDLARVQERMIKNRTRSRDYPWIVVGNGRFTDKECGVEEGSLGVYNSACNTMQVNFKSRDIFYEYPIEVLTTMAHEQGHHLINLTVGTEKISRLEQELIADCFAGVMHGYWAKWDKISKEEFKKAGEMMIQVSKEEESMTDEHGDSGQRLGAFVAGAARANGKMTVQYKNFCVGLDRVIDFSKGLP